MNLNTKILILAVEALQKLEYQPETIIAVIFQELALNEEAGTLKDRFCKVFTFVLYPRLFSLIS